MCRLSLLLIISIGILFLTGIMTGSSTTTLAPVNTTAPQTVEEHLLQGDAYHSFGLDENATREYRTALAMNASNPNAWNNLGLSLTNLGRHEEARQALENATRLNPADPDAWYNLGYTFGMLKKPDQEIASYEKALNISPNMTVAWRNLGVVRFEQGNYTAAVAALEKATRYDPASVAGWYYLGITYEKAGNLTGAAQVLKKAYEMDKNQTVIKERLDAIEKNLSANPVPEKEAKAASTPGKSPLPAGIAVTALLITVLGKVQR
jgi:tetratricopeptide (TPR) repeat protein